MELKEKDLVICVPGQEKYKQEWELISGKIYVIGTNNSTFHVYFENDKRRSYRRDRLILIDPKTLSALEKIIYGL